MNVIKKYRYKIQGQVHWFQEVSTTTNLDPKSNKIPTNPFSGWTVLMIATPLNIISERELSLSIKPSLAKRTKDLEYAVPLS